MRDLKIQNILSVLLFYFFLILLYSVFGFHDDIWFTVTNFVILALCWAGLFSRLDRYFTLTKTFFLVCLVLFGITPLIALTEDVYYWDIQPYKPSTAILTNLCIVLFLICFYCSTKIKISIDGKWISQLSNFGRPINRTPLVLISLFSGFFVLRSRDFDLLGLVFRGGYDHGVVEFSSFNQQLGLLFDAVIRPMPMIVLSVLYLSFRESSNRCRMKLWVPKRFLLFAMTCWTVLVCFPTGMARYQAVTLYLALLFSSTGLFNKKYSFQLCGIFSVLTIFPILDFFRRYDGFHSSNISLNFSYFYTGHFDAYQNFALVLENNIITWGSQAVGVLLFFVPRELWTGKPIGSGSLLSNLLGMEFSNISMPIIGEGFVNFGIVGIVLFSLIIGITVGMLDRLIWVRKTLRIGVWLRCYYFFLFGILIFITRGDLINAFSYLCGVTTSFFCVWLLSRFPRLSL